MKCPKCGYERQPRDNQYVPATECPGCGIVYAKSDVMPDYSSRNASGSSLKKTSPVDEESLRKARERVEKRLRKQLETRVYDEKHAQTLQRARMLTSQAMAKRKAERDSEMSAVEALKTALDDAPPPDPPKGADSEPVPDLAAIAMQGDQTKASPDRQLDQVPDEGETAAAAVSAETQPHPFDDPPAPEENLSSTAEIADHAHMEPGDEEKQIDQPAPEDAFQAEAEAEAETAENEAPQGAYTLNSEPGEEPAASLAPPFRQADGYPAQSLKVGGGPARLFSLAAWIILLAGAVGTVLSWTTLGNVQADLGSAPAAQAHLMPFGLLLGFAYLATGVLGFAFFWVSSLINRQLRDIRQLLLNLPLPLPQGGHENAPWVDRDDELRE